MRCTSKHHWRGIAVDGWRHPSESVCPYCGVGCDRSRRPRAPSVAVNTRGELCPWLYSEQYPSVQTYGRSAIYQIQADHPNGRLTAYLDGGTANESRKPDRPGGRRPSDVATTDQTVATESSSPSRADHCVVAVIATTALRTMRPSRSPSTNRHDRHRWRPRTVEPRGEYTVTAITQDGDRVECCHARCRDAVPWDSLLFGARAMVTIARGLPGWRWRMWCSMSTKPAASNIRSASSSS